MIIYFSFIVITAAHTHSTMKLYNSSETEQCCNPRLTFGLKILINKTPAPYSPGPTEFSLMQQDTILQSFDVSRLLLSGAVTMAGANVWAMATPPPYTHTHTHTCVRAHTPACAHAHKHTDVPISTIL